MVDIADVAKANRLNGERAQIDAALNLLDAGQTLTAFGIGPTPTPESLPPPPFMVRISGMETMPQMIEAFKTFLHQREDQIASELESLGVTGVEVQARGAVGAPPQPPPQHQPAAQPPPRPAPKPAPHKRR